MVDALAIVIAPDGAVTTPHFAELDAAGYPAHLYVHIRSLMDFADLSDVTVRDAGGLVIWVNGQEIVRRRSLNLTASIAVAKFLGAPLPTLYGPVLITGGRVCEPLPLSDWQVVEALQALDLGVDEITSN